ncbi:hypothetical protein [Halostagnicola sp. A-GB9-2]|uniref:capsular polysaccharide export protein, LipB/KpsS family n=1 Tax=Halostagnicola sp. A-GB9-2 TaxID=3048066 RepID=UPI0024BFB9CB|nr:hypothetical protein [Halostagnicola sp. A-GB9-2]MDJ1431980.1 hypothetical protein [Halostagnicola sp. A-GB9-2]
MTKQVIISGVSITDWIQAIKQLSDSIEPCYWICRGEIKNKVEERFPNCITHQSIDCIQGRPVKEYDTDEPFYHPLDKDILEDHLFNESIALKMMDRLDTGNVTNSNFTYGGRIRHFHRMVTYWEMVLDDLSPDLAIFGSTPHLVSDYILYSCCKSRGIDTLIYSSVSLPDLFYVRECIDGPPVLSSGTIKNSGGISDKNDRYINSLRKEYEEAIPEYMTESQSNSSIIPSLEGLTKISKSVIQNAITACEPFPTAYVKEHNNQIEDSRLTKYQWYFYRLKAWIYRRKLYKHYRRYTIDPDISTKYIYFPLHYQPERTTSPEGGLYVHQYLAVNLLSQTLPKTTIYVKEHPSQFSKRIKGEQGRRPYFYQDMSNIHNVELVPLKTPVFDLVDNSCAVATVTGTTGWEALVRGTPALVFGNAWYRNSPGCYHIKSQSDLIEAIEKINSSSRSGPTIESIKRFASKMEEICYQGYIKPYEGDNTQENSSVLANSIIDNY